MICAANFYRVDLIRKSIAIGIDVDSQDSRGQTALLRAHELADDHFDTRTDDIEDDVEYETRVVELVDILEILLRAGANPCIPDDDLRTPSNNMHSFCDQLTDLYGNYIRSMKRERPTKLHQAVAIGELDAVERLFSDKRHSAQIDAGDSQGFTPMHYAILWWRGDSKNIVKHLLYNNANPNIPDVYGRTPLHYSVALRATSTPLIKWIRDAGGGLDTKDRLRRRRVDIAVAHTSIDTYHMLIKTQKIRFHGSGMGDVVHDDVSISDFGRF